MKENIRKAIAFCSTTYGPEEFPCTISNDAANLFSNNYAEYIEIATEIDLYFYNLTHK